MAHRGSDPQICFWRTIAGMKVDIVVEAGAKLVAIEVKLSATVRLAVASAIDMFQKNFGDKVLGGKIK